MFIQLTEQDRKVLEYKSSGTLASREEGDQEWTITEGKPFRVALVYDKDVEIYMIVYGNESEIKANRWHHMWRDGDWVKALNYFTGYISDLEHEEIMAINHRITGSAPVLTEGSH
jgi:hypothetical protein